jgi:hypothetical protein
MISSKSRLSRKRVGSSNSSSSSTSFWLDQAGKLVFNSFFVALS